jgi:nicotinamidase-related amidase
MGELRAAIAGTARHLCIDMQRLFSPQGPWPTPWMERVLPVVLQLVERSPQRTIFTRFIPPGQPDEMPGCWRDYYRKWREVTRERLDPTLLELMPELRRLVPPALVLDKMVYSAFADGRLHRRLREDGADTLIVTGSETDVCVLASVLAAVDHGYRVVLARDAVCSSSDRAHDALLEIYRRRFDLQIELADSAEIIEAWQL